MKAYFLHDWAESGIEQLKSDFEINDKELEGIEILLASYSYHYYSGEAFVLCRKDGKLYEVNGNHCSCYGLEGQWALEETNIEVLRHRIQNGTLGEDKYTDTVFKNELIDILNQLGQTNKAK